MVDRSHVIQKCTLLNGYFETLVQISLGIIAISVLIVKRYAEKPRRPFGVWLFDALKQAIGAGVAHIVNLSIAIALVRYSKEKTTDECAMYFINFTLDTSLGLFLNWILLNLLVKLAYKWNWTSLQVPGDYGDPISFQIWFIQLITWLIIIILAKLIIRQGILLTQSTLILLSSWLFKPFQYHPHIELILVMIACPCFMNCFQFWIQDNFLKKRIKYEYLPRTIKKQIYDDD